jgi:hypothetical protein
MSGFRSSLMPQPSLQGRPAPSYVPAERVRPQLPAPPPVMEIPRFLHIGYAARREKAKEVEGRLQHAHGLLAKANADRRLRLEKNAGVDFLIAEIVAVVSAISGVQQNDLLSARRNEIVSRARQVVFWLCGRFTNRSLPDIGRRVGGRDHTTVLHGKRRVQVAVDSIPAPAEDTPEAWARALLSVEWPKYKKRGRPA